MDTLTPKHRPRLTVEQAGSILKERYGLAGTLKALPSERDQNFRVHVNGADDGVLKFSNPGEDRALLALEHRLQTWLADRVPEFRFPVPRPGADGETIGEVDGDGERLLVRLLSWVPGVPLAAASPHDPPLLKSVGRLLGSVARALDGLDDAVAHRSLRWDLRRADEVIETNLGHVSDPGRRALAARLAESSAGPVARSAASLRTGLIHNDGNDHNVIVADVRGDAVATVTRCATGLIDFGDVVHSWIVAEPAVACAYAMMEKTDPVAVAGAVVAGYHDEWPLTEDELEVLPHLIVRRLLMSVTLAATQSAAEPDNAYLSVSEAPAWRLLETLATLSPNLLHYALRHRCGLEPVPSSPGLVSWLQAHADQASPVLDPDPASVPSVIVDLSVESLEMGSQHVEGLDASGFTELLFGRMEAAGAHVALGRYDEARRWYDGDAHAHGSERRTVHLGVDLFARPGTPVCAPFDGVVHSVADNDQELDYGPTLVLEHRWGEDGRFFTLYGHLGAEVLAILSPGDSVTAGQEVASVGDFPGNGDWPPHLHFQVVADMLGRVGEFPGVAPPSEREVWLSLSPDPNIVLGIEGLAPAHRGPGKQDLVEARRANLGPTLSVSYHDPLKIVRGAAQFLYDDLGRDYLDCVNNVAHVGHCHPRVVGAMTDQAGVLNTNTRYLHELLVRYAQRLTGTLPDPLSVCFLVCSGSEANELALRMARAHTGARDVLVVDGAYHGNTSSLVDLSPYKFDGPGGEGAPDWVHPLPMPDAYRGRHRGPEAGDDYVLSVQHALAELAREGGGVAAFFCESVLSCGGQIVLPDGYLSGAADAVRRAGGVYVADEVQVGFGRVGSHFWAFETQGVVPDIVTMGKPIGNGHPLAAVVTTPEIAESFDTGMEYFNTFGGNPVSCAAGLAVLDVIRDEGLQENAYRVGSRLKEALSAVGEEHPVIGDVRGMGLFLGIELVLDRQARIPAPEHAAHLVERMRANGILLSTDGPEHNVIKIKPPLVFSAEDADRVVRVMDVVLREDAFRVS